MIIVDSPETLSLVNPLDHILSQPATEVPLDQIASPAVQGVIDRMIELSEGKGHSKEDSRQMVGLAAVQLGVSLRIVSIDMTADGSNKKQTLEVIVNPKITNKADEQLEGREGCWSCGNICGNVERSAKVTLEGYDREGVPVVHKLAGFVARIAQHETDHLDGIRFPDRIPTTHPERLHLVEPSEFDDYREQWQTWPNICPREQWEAMKAGEQA